MERRGRGERGEWREWERERRGEWEGGRGEREGGKKEIISIQFEDYNTREVILGQFGLKMYWLNSHLLQLQKKMKRRRKGKGT